MLPSRDPLPGTPPQQAHVGHRPRREPREPPLDVLERELGHAAHSILAEFVGELRRAMALLASASPTERADAAHVQHAAHRLVGAARTLGAIRLAQEAEALQKASREGDPSPVLQAAVIAVTRATAKRYGLGTLRDLRKVPNLTIAGFPEWETRWTGPIAKQYGVRGFEFVPLAGISAYTLLSQKKVLAADVFTTDPQLLSSKYV